jgi:hypothetical protein
MTDTAGIMYSHDHHWLVKALHEAADEIERQFLSMSEDELRHRPADDEWSPKEIAGHLRDCEELFLDRLRLIERCHEPELSDIDVESYPTERGYQELDLDDVLLTFAALRRQTCYLLWSLTPDEWERRGIHPYRGSLSIMDVARDINRHDLTHLWQMQRARESRDPHGDEPA